MKLTTNLFLGLIMIVMAACKDDDFSSYQTTIVWDFSQDEDGWTADFADYPEGEEGFYELSFEYAMLPGPLDDNDGALKVSGNNHSDDLFMFVKSKISGLTPNATYDLTFNIEFASNVADNQFGVGGSPGEGVSIKAGATKIEPAKMVGSDNNYQMNIDKGNQTQGGADMIVIGDFSNDTDKNEYTLKTVSNQTPFEVNANEDGEIWIIVGTDSGFEATTTIYYNEIKVILK